MKELWQFVANGVTAQNEVNRIIKKATIMKLYLTEVRIAGRMEPVGLFSKSTRAKGIVGRKAGLITELEVDKHYKKGIGVANHWHLNDGDPSEQKGEQHGKLSEEKTERGTAGA
jgi:hypothetical protein